MQMIVAADAAPLRERDAELGAVDEATSSAVAGRGSVILVEGYAGKGKSRLLAEAAARVEAAGMDVLCAVGGDVERDFAFGIAFQLLEGRVRRAGPTERSRLFVGAAALA